MRAIYTNLDTLSAILYENALFSQSFPKPPVLAARTPSPYRPIGRKRAFVAPTIGSGASLATRFGFNSGPDLRTYPWAEHAVRIRELRRVATTAVADDLIVAMVCRARANGAAFKHLIRPIPSGLPSAPIATLSERTVPSSSAPMLLRILR